jgi:hypothetical protein
LYNIFPALVILPSLVIAVIAHFVVQSSKADAKSKLAKLFPMSTKTIVSTTTATGTSVAVNEKDISLSQYYDRNGTMNERSEDKSSNDSVSDTDSHDDSQDGLYTDDAHATTEQESKMHHEFVHKTQRQTISTGVDVIRALRDHQDQYYPREKDSLSIIYDYGNNEALSSECTMSSSSVETSSSEDSNRRHRKNDRSTVKKERNKNDGVGIHSEWTYKDSLSTRSIDLSCFNGETAITGSQPTNHCTSHSNGNSSWSFYSSKSSYSDTMSHTGSSAPSTSFK